MAISSKKSGGFTLIELLAVIIIMGVIAALTIMAAKGARRKADYDGAKAGVQYIAARVDSYYNKRGQLPPDIDGDGFTTEMEIYQTLKDWGFEISPEKQVDPWGNPYVIILQRDYADGTTTPAYGKTFDLASSALRYDAPSLGGKSYLNIGLSRMKDLYEPSNPSAQQKAIHKTKVTDPCYENQNDGFQVISAGPDGKIYLYDDPTDPDSLKYNGDNITNWQK